MATTNITKQIETHNSVTGSRTTLMMTQTKQSFADWYSNLTISDTLTGSIPTRLRTLLKAPSHQGLETVDVHRYARLAHRSTIGRINEKISSTNLSGMNPFSARSHWSQERSLHTRSHEKLVSN